MTSRSRWDWRGERQNVAYAFRSVRDWGLLANLQSKLSTMTLLEKLSLAEYAVSSIEILIVSESLSLDGTIETYSLI